MEKYGLSVKELEAQHTELLPDRIEMRHRRRRRHGLYQDCDTIIVNQGTLTFVTPAGAVGSNVCVIA